MNWIISLALKWSGFGWVWTFIDGKKTYIQAAAEMLSGAGGMLLGAAAEATRFTSSVHSIGDVYGFVQGLIHNPDPPVAAITLAYAAFWHGWGVMAKKHADDKKHAELLAAAALPQPAPAPAAAPAPAGPGA